MMTSVIALNALNFFMADVRGGFGPFLGVLLQGNTKHAEIGEFICLQVESIFEKEAYWNVDETTVRRAEGQQHDQDA
jgi:hypothetical protein